MEEKKNTTRGEEDRKGASAGWKRIDPRSVVLDPLGSSSNVHPFEPVATPREEGYWTPKVAATERTPTTEPRPRALHVDASGSSFGSSFSSTSANRMDESNDDTSYKSSAKPSSKSSSKSSNTKLSSSLASPTSAHLSVVGREKKQPGETRPGHPSGQDETEDLIPEAIDPLKYLPCISDTGVVEFASDLDLSTIPIDKDKWKWLHASDAKYKCRMCSYACGDTTESGRLFVLYSAENGKYSRKSGIPIAHFNSWACRRLFIQSQKASTGHSTSQLIDEDIQDEIMPTHAVPVTPESLAVFSPNGKGLSIEQWMEVNTAGTSEWILRVKESHREYTEFTPSFVRLPATVAKPAARQMPPPVGGTSDLKYQNGRQVHSIHMAPVLPHATVISTKLGQVSQEPTDEILTANLHVERMSARHYTKRVMEREEYGSGMPSAIPGLPSSSSAVSSGGGNKTTTSTTIPTRRNDTPSTVPRVASAVGVESSLGEKSTSSMWSKSTDPMGSTSLGKMAPPEPRRPPSTGKEPVTSLTVSALGSSTASTLSSLSSSPDIRHQK